jgi:hypothetical protein
MGTKIRPLVGLPVEVAMLWRIVVTHVFENFLKKKALYRNLHLLQ